MIYQLRHKSVVLLENSQFKTISSKEEALDFLQLFNLDSETLNQLIWEGDDKAVPEAWDNSKKLAKIAESILLGDIVITQRHNPPKVEDSASPEIESNVGNRAHSLGPEGAGSASYRVGGAAGRTGVYTPRLTTRTNAELGIGGTRTPEQAKEILARAGIDAPLDEYNFIPLDNDSFTNIVVNQTGRDAYASYGIIPPGAKHVSFREHIQSSGKVPVYVRDDVFDSDESIVQILGHEVFEIEELRYVAHTPISVKQYNNLVGDGIYDNLHYNAVLEGDDLLRAYRKLEGL